MNREANEGKRQARDGEPAGMGSAGRAHMKIFLINLDRCADRLEHMRAQLNGVAFERISAIDGANDPPTAKGLTRFELACLESHKIAWRKLLSGQENHACFLEDDVHIWPGFAALLAEEAWIPKDAHSVKLDTYLQKVELGDRRVAIGGRQVARLYSRHQSSAAYILSRGGAARYLDLTANASLPADYSLFPDHPRRFGLRIYQLSPAIAIQDHLMPPGEGGRAFSTAMAGDRESAAPRRSSMPGKLARETARLAGQFAGLAEWTYRRALLRVETTTVEVG
jgi:glycosyl transferase, family 25